MPPPDKPSQGPIGQRLANLSPDKLELLRRLMAQREVTDDRLPIPRRAPGAGPLPLSFAQQRLWFLHQLMPDNPFYNLASAWHLAMAVQGPALERSLNEIVRRHESLRTIFTQDRGQPVQVVLPDLHVPLQEIDLRGLPAPQREREALSLALQEARRPFDLVRGPLMATWLLRLAEADYLFLVTMHHIVSDGWSMGIFFQELGQLYSAYATGQEMALPELPIQYADYALWQRQWLRGQVLERQLAFWQERLAALPTLELPTDRRRPAMPSFQGAHRPVMVPDDLAQALRQLSQQARTTLFMTLLAAFATLLARYTGQEDIVIGTPVAGRSRVELEGLIGFFVNTLVMRCDLRGDPTFLDLLARVRQVALDAYAHQDLPFEMLVERLQPARDLSRNPLFQVLFQLRTASPGTPGSSPTSMSPLDLEIGTSVLDLALTLGESEAGLKGNIEYSTDLYEAARVERMAGHFQCLLAGIVANPATRLSQLPLLTSAEQHQLLGEWSGRDAGFRSQAAIHHLFEEQAHRRPNATAVVCDGQSLSYGGLNAKANRLAHALLAMDVGPETLVGICLERSPDLIASMLAVLKAAGAFLPLDPGYPAARLAYMLDDAGVRVVLAKSAYRQALGAAQARTIWLDEVTDDLASQSSDDPAVAVAPDNLAYVIYTSGSTGKPKGALLAHRGLCNVSAAQRQAFGIGPDDRVLQFSSSSFDASIFETIMALAQGASLHIPTGDATLPGEALARYLREQRITIVTLPPSALGALPVTDLPDLHTVTVAGEACPAGLIGRWAGGRRFFNLYGPTEATIWSTVAACTAGMASPPIGLPIANTRAYVLDSHLQPLPVGVPGELYIGGVGLARGYVNQSRLTAQCFLPDPFDDRPGGRMYRTGDRVRRRPDGELEFLGRLDHQVKLRGFRIELGEIEAVLNQSSLVREAVVVVGNNGRLAAYLVPAGPAAPSIDQMRHLAQQELPGYMVPGTFVFLEHLPLTPNGKVDRAALPEVDAARPSLARPYAEPQSEIEARLAAIWAEVLDLDQVGIHDDFFSELGGHSLLATQVASRIRDAFQLEIPLRRLFEAPTVAELAASIQLALWSQAGGWPEQGNGEVELEEGEL